MSLFLDWYGGMNAWDAFEAIDVLLALIAIAALVVAAGVIAPELAYVDRRALPALAVAAAIVIAAQLDPPPAAAGETLEAGVWIAFAAALVMVIGAVMSLGKVSLAVSVEGRDDGRERVAVVDHRQDTTDTAAVVPPETARGKRD